MKCNKQPSVMFIAPSAYVLGGVATWLDYMEPGLTELGWDVIIGLVEGPRHHRPERYLAEHPHKNWLAISCKTGTREGRVRAVERAISKIKPNIIATVNIPDAILGVARSRQNVNPKLKVAMTVHGIQPDIYDDIRACRPWLDRVLCTNRLACELAVEWGNMDATHVVYAPCGVACHGQSRKSKLGDQLKIAYVGRLEQDQKRVFDLPQILAFLDQASVPYELMIAGTGPDEKKLRTEFGSRIDDGKVSFFGFLSPEQLQRQVLAEADILLLTSSWETGPIVAWEAMAASVAVVSSRYIGSGLESALHHDDNALMFDIGDCKTAALQLQRLWREAGLIERLRQAAFRLVRERYSIPISVANWDFHLRSLLDQAPLKQTSTIGTQAALGRLDRLLGGGAAESIRSMLGTTGPDSGAGGEWPHSHGKTNYWDDEFWQMAEELDHCNEEVVPA